MKISVTFYQDRNLGEYKLNIYKHINEYFQNNNDKYNYKYILYKDFKLVKSDYAIMWNIPGIKENTIYRQKIIDFQKKHNNKLIIMEEGFIQRGTYYALSYESIINFGNYPSYPDDLKRFNLLNLKINSTFPTKFKKCQHILFCLQIYYDTQVYFLNYEKWVKKTLVKIRKYCNRKIILRKHPNDNTPFFTGIISWLKKTKFKNYEISNNSLKKDFEQVYCVIALNSTILIDAVLQYKPILAGHYSSIVYDIAEKKIENINNLQKFSKEDIINCLKKITYKQWSLEEIKNGTAFPYYIKN